MRFDPSPQWDDLGQYVPPEEDPPVSLPRRALTELWEILCTLTAAVVAYLKVALVFALLAAALAPPGRCWRTAAAAAGNLLSMGARATGSTTPAANPERVWTRRPAPEPPDNPCP